MQLTPDMGVLAYLSTAVLSVVLSVFLLVLWARQKNHLYTDLPLLFGVMFVAQAFNSVIRTLPTLGVLEASLDIFRFRTLVMLGSVLPLTVMVLFIWLPRMRAKYTRILGALTLYWAAVTLLAPSEALIMILCIPIILVLTVAMVVTFSITWKTGRLREVRSDLMVLCFVLGIMSQLTASMVLVNNALWALGTVAATLALTNPWYKRKQSALTKQNEVYSSLDT